MQVPQQLLPCSFASQKSFLKICRRLLQPCLYTPWLYSCLFWSIGPLLPVNLPLKWILIPCYTAQCHFSGPPLQTQLHLQNWPHLFLEKLSSQFMDLPHFTISLDEAVNNCYPVTFHFVSSQGYLLDIIFHISYSMANFHSACAVRMGMFLFVLENLQHIEKYVGYSSCSILCMKAVLFLF